MFRRSALTAAASLAVVLLAVTGCKVQVSAADPGGGSTADGASTAGAVQAGTYNSRLLIPEVLVKGAEYAVVRPRPSYEDLIGLDKIPPWLA